MTLKILQVIPSLSLVYGGPSQMVLGLSKALAAQGVTVTIVTTDANGDAGQAPLDVPIDRPVLQDGYEIRYFRSAVRRYKFSLPLLRWLSDHAQAYDLAHIHALFSPVSTAAATIARWQNLPYILRPLGTLDPADLQKKRFLKQIYAGLFERPNLAQAAALHFTSDQEAKISDRFGSTAPNLVLPLGVSLPPLPTDRAEASPAAVPTVLYLSRLDRKKGLDLLFPALQRLQAEGVAFQFVLAGANPQDPNYDRQIQQQIQQSALATCTQIVGFVTGEAKAALLRSADLFVLPSYYENFGIAVAEAMAAAVPVVISDQVHIWPTVAASEAGWVSACTVADLTEQLRSALQNPGDRQRRSQNARRCVATHYSWEAIAVQMIQAYEALLKSSSRA